MQASRKQWSILTINLSSLCYNGVPSNRMSSSCSGRPLWPLNKPRRLTNTPRETTTCLPQWYLQLKQPNNMATQPWRANAWYYRRFLWFIQMQNNRSHNSSQRHPHGHLHWHWRRLPSPNPRQDSQRLWIIWSSTTQVPLLQELDYPSWEWAANHSSRFQRSNPYTTAHDTSKDSSHLLSNRRPSPLPSSNLPGIFWFVYIPQIFTHDHGPNWTQSTQLNLKMPWWRRTRARMGASIVSPIQ